MSDHSTDSPKKSKKPADTAFKQQRLPAWQPVMTAKTVIPAFFVIGIVFVPVGAVLYTTSQSVQEHIIDYTSLESCKKCFDDLNTTGAHEVTYSPCTCNIGFELPKFEGNVYMYYGLENYYQNHRRYVKSRDDPQLLGEVRAPEGSNKLTDDCDPYRLDALDETQMIAPCGAIANSLFNDTLTLRYEGVSVPLIKRGIAWPTDKASKFRNPEVDPGVNLCNATAFKNTVKPPNWPKHVCELDLDDPDNNGYQNEDLIVWMRSSALPNFRKLYRKIDHSSDTFKDGLPAGNYTLEIIYNYPVKAFDGRKKMILSTVSWLGGKNPFLGLAYIVVGILCIILAIIFLVIHCRIGKSTEEMADVTPRTAYM